MAEQATSHMISDGSQQKQPQQHHLGGSGTAAAVSPNASRRRFTISSVRDLGRVLPQVSKTNSNASSNSNSSNTTTNRPTAALPGGQGVAADRRRTQSFGTTSNQPAKPQRIVTRRPSIPAAASSPRVPSGASTAAAAAVTQPAGNTPESATTGVNALKAEKFWSGMMTDMFESAAPACCRLSSIAETGSAALQAALMADEIAAANAMAATKSTTAATTMATKAALTTTTMMPKESQPEMVTISGSAEFKQTWDEVVVDPTNTEDSSNNKKASPSGQKMARQVRRVRLVGPGPISSGNYVTITAARQEPVSEQHSINKHEMGRRNSQLNGPSTGRFP